MFSVFILFNSISFSRIIDFCIPILGILGNSEDRFGFASMTSVKFLKVCKELYQLLCKHVILVLIAFLCLGLTITFMGAHYLFMNLVEAQAIQYAEAAVQTLNEARKLYSSNVVHRVTAIDGVTVGAEYHNLNGGIPNPATYTIELGERLSDEPEGMLFKLYSDYPFPNRRLTGGAKDQFERDALAYLKANPTDSFYRKEKIGDCLLFRYTQAVIMEPSCVTCHNTLSNSPKKNWEIGEVRGVVEVTQSLSRITLIAQDGLKAIYTVLATIIALAVSGLVLVIHRLRTINRDLEIQVAERTAKLSHLANLDGLTQLANRRQFDRVIQREYFRTRRKQEPISLIMCDVDYFKSYNDTYGHQAGDDCLCAIAQVLKGNIKRSGELAARYGGEEFAIILPNVDGVGATQIATMIQNEMHHLKIPHDNLKAKPYVTLSMGIVTAIPGPNDSCQQLIKTADKALYQAKNQGRDRFVVLHQLFSIGNKSTV